MLSPLLLDHAYVDVHRGFLIRHKEGRSERKWTWTKLRHSDHKTRTCPTKNMLLITECWLFFKRPAWATVDLFFTSVSPYLTKLCRLLKKKPAYWVQQLLCHPKPPQPIRGEWEKSHALYRFSALSPLVQISLEMSNCQQG